MSSLAAIALEIENSRPQCDQLLKDLSVRNNFFGSKKFKSCSWSNYFVEEGTSKSGLSQATAATSNLDAVPEKASFPTKKLREYLRNFSTERASSPGGHEYDDHQIDWVNMAAKLSTKSQIFTARDCYIHYTNVESKDINKGIWGADEDRKLLALVNASEVRVVGIIFSFYSIFIARCKLIICIISMYPQECGWVKIADDLGTSRTPLQCLQRYQQALNVKLVNSTEWTTDEDNLLRKGVELFGTKNWQNVASMISGRSAVQCGARYRKSSKSRDDIVDGSWTEIDERRLFLAAIAYDIPTSSIFKKSASEIEAFLALDDTPHTGDEGGSSTVTPRLTNEEIGVQLGPGEPRRDHECVVKEKKKYNMTRSANVGAAPADGVQVRRCARLSEVNIYRLLLLKMCVCVRVLLCLSEFCVCVRYLGIELHVIDRINRVTKLLLQLIKQSQLWAAVAKLVPGK
jgi:Myb-like DNA-binding domain